jgi:hypothetical protein
MVLKRDTDEALIGEIAGLKASWVQSETFESLVELNRQCLELLAEQSLTQPMQGNLLLRQVGEIWRTLDDEARRRAASCPYLLFDAGFADSARWRSVEGQYVSESTTIPYATFFTVPRASAVVRQVFIYAWYLAQSKSVSAQLLLGMPNHCTHLISAHTLTQIHELAERHPEWMRPRWPNRVRVWRDFLLAAASGDVVALENARMHGIQLIAAECRAASLQALKNNRTPER